MMRRAGGLRKLSALAHVCAVDMVLFLPYLEKSKGRNRMYDLVKLTEEQSEQL
jgi:hypothetical protein